MYLPFDSFNKYLQCTYCVSGKGTNFLMYDFKLHRAYILLCNMDNKQAKTKKKKPSCFQ